MSNGAAILNFGDEFGPNSVEKAMRNDGPNLAANNLSANKVTPCNKTQDDDRVTDKDDMRQMGSVRTGMNETSAYGKGD